MTLMQYLTQAKLTETADIIFLIGIKNLSLKAKPFLKICSKLNITYTAWFLRLSVQKHCIRISVYLFPLHTVKNTLHLKLSLQFIKLFL